MRSMNPGDLLEVVETLRVSTPGNPAGRAAACYSDDMNQIVFFLEPGTSVILMEDPRTRYVRVLSPRGPVWMMKSELKHS